MNEVVEKNDVDILPLFSWNRKFKLSSGDTSVDVFMRVLGDADLNRARVMALRRSAELRRKLRDLNSDERMAYIPDIEDMDVEQLVGLITVFSMRDLTKIAKGKLKIKPPKPPKSDAPTEKHEKYQEELDSYPQRLQDELRATLEVEVEKMKKSLEKESKESLYNLFVVKNIEELCELELARVFKELCAFFGSYSDETLKTRLFTNFEDFENMPTSLKSEFVAAYQSLELTGNDLKKLQEVTP